MKKLSKFWVAALISSCELNSKDTDPTVETCRESWTVGRLKRKWIPLCFPGWKVETTPATMASRGVGSGEFWVSKFHHWKQRHVNSWQHACIYIYICMCVTSVYRSSGILFITTSRATWLVGTSFSTFSTSRSRQIIKKSYAEECELSKTQTKKIRKTRIKNQSNTCMVCVGIEYLKQS